MPCARKDFFEGLPKSHAAVADRDLRRHGQPAAFDVDEQLTPALRALPDANLEAEKLLLAFRRGPDDDQDALGGGRHPGLAVDAVGLR